MEQKPWHLTQRNQLAVLFAQQLEGKLVASDSDVSLRYSESIQTD